MLDNQVFNVGSSPNRSSLSVLITPPFLSFPFALSLSLSRAHSCMFDLPISLFVLSLPSTSFCSLPNSFVGPLVKRPDRWRWRFGLAGENLACHLKPLRYLRFE